MKATSIITTKISKVDFDKLLSVIEKYKQLSHQTDIDSLIEKLNACWAKKDFTLLTKDEARRIVIILDMVNVMKVVERFITYDTSLEKLYQNLSKAFSKIYNEGAYIK